MRKRQNSLFPSYQGTALAITYMTDAARFQMLCDRLLETHWHYELHPRGISEHGTVKGQPDSWGYDSKGRLCAFQYGICKRTNWPEKLKKDLEEVASIAQFSPEIFVFCTNCSIDPEKEREWIAKVKNDYKWNLRIIGALELANVLDTTQQGTRKDLLDIDVEHHNWDSLLAACKEQRQKQIKQHTWKYDPSLYVQRQAEQKIQAWYRQMVISMHQGKSHAQRFAVVDQAGVGKTSLVLHLTEEFGNHAPAIIIPGNVIITDRHTLEREIVEAVNYPLDDRTYHAKIHEICQLAQQNGFPLLVILDGADENNEPTKLRIAIEYLWNICQNYPFLFLVTCRDASWTLIQTSLWKNLSEKQPYTTQVISLGEYNDDEFRQAYKCYFSKYNVNVTLGYEAEQRLHSPLLLRIFAEVNQDCSPRLIGSVADKDLWRKYLEIKVDAIYEALERGIRKQTIQTVIENIALLMVRKNKSTLSLDELATIHSLLNPDDTSSRSLFFQLKNTTVFFEDVSGNVKFVHESFLEFIAGIALSQNFEKNQEHTDILTWIEELARNSRWRQIPLYIAKNVSHPVTIIERLCVPNVWLAAEAIKQLQALVPLNIRTRVIMQLEEKLSSKFTLDRDRAARFLGLLGASESLVPLLRSWRSDKSSAVLCALARLGCEEVMKPFIYYLGKYAHWYWPEDQELVNNLPQPFRQRLIETALATLRDPEHASMAAHTLGYLKCEQAVEPLFTYLVSVEYCDGIALAALLHIQTEESFNAVEIAMSEIGKKLDSKDQLGIPTRDTQETAPTHSDLYMTLDLIRVYGVQQCSPKKIIPFLLRLLSHPNEYVRHIAVRCLGQIGASETALTIIQSEQSEIQNPTMGLMETLLEFGTQINAEPLITIVNNPSVPAHVLQYVIRALGVSRDNRAIGVFKRFSKKPQFLVDVVLALGDSSLPEAVPLLAQILESTNINLLGSNITNKATLDHMIIDMLGKLQYPSAFGAIENFAKNNLPIVGVSTISALAVTGREQAIPFLCQAWELNSADKRAIFDKRTILQAFLWIGTKTAANKIKDLLRPYNQEKAELLTKALRMGRRLPLSGTWTRSSAVYDWVDDELIDILDKYVDGMSKDDKLTVIFALEYIAVPSAQRLLERIASDPQYDIQRSNDSPQTLRDVAVQILCRSGSEIALHFLLDKLADHSLGFLEHFLVKMQREQVRDALHRHLDSANDPTLSKILTLLGFFGDHTTLPMLTTYIDDPRIEIANNAYTAEQRILGLA